MFIRFSFKNFKSVGSKPVKLEMVSSTRIRSLEHHVCPSSTDAKVLRNAVIYGGNAAGKSTIVSAFSFMRAAVLNGELPPNATKDYCRCETGHRTEKTVFDIQFQVDDTAYDYGFSCLLSNLEVTSEWFYALDSEPTLLFERFESGEINCPEIEKTASDEDKIRLNVYRDDFLHRTSTGIKLNLFLSTMGNERAFSEDSLLNAFQKARRWFAAELEVIGASQPLGSTEFYSDNSTLDNVAEVLSSFDTGINGLSKQELTMDELEQRLPPQVMFTLREFIRTNTPKTPTDKFVLTLRNDGFFLGVELEGFNPPRATVLKIAHEGSLLDFEFSDESDGTRRLFDFMDILFTRSKSKVFVIDELNRSFHPMLTQHLLALFNEVHASDDCQLVFTTHENAIMSHDFFRRDEIWFIERDNKGYSNLYPLDQFANDSARSDARLGKRYMEGRYGGVPVLSTSQALSALGVEEV